MPWASRSTVTRPSRPGTAISPSVCGNERRTSTTPATRAATTTSTMATPTYVIHRPQRGHRAKPRPARPTRPAPESSVTTEEDPGEDGDAAVSGTADILPCRVTPFSGCPTRGRGQRTASHEFFGKFADLPDVGIIGSRTRGVPGPRSPRASRPGLRMNRGGPVPTYQYACTACDHTFEQFQSFSDDALTVCPQCEGRLRKVFNAVGVVFKGSGFYRTDSRSDATSSNGDKSSSGDKSPSGGADGSSGDSNGSSPGKSSTSDAATSSTSTTTSGSSAA